MTHELASKTKAWTTLRGRETVALGRELLGGNGIVADFLVRAPVRGLALLFQMYARILAVALHICRLAKRASQSQHHFAFLSCMRKCACFIKMFVSNAIGKAVDVWITKVRHVCQSAGRTT